MADSCSLERPGLVTVQRNSLAHLKYPKHCKKNEKNEAPKMLYRNTHFGGVRLAFCFSRDILLHAAKRCCPESTKYVPDTEMLINNVSLYILFIPFHPT